jgi:putative SOS response-associated peptidase YedK
MTKLLFIPTPCADACQDHPHINFHCIARLNEAVIRHLGWESSTLGGIRSVWHDPVDGTAITTVSIVTTAANPLMAGIHNNPKGEGPRMPFIVPRTLDERWLRSEPDNDRISSLIRPFPEVDLEEWTVAPLLGKHASPNTAEALKPFDYPELALLG